jgi:hypothetical protein
MARTTPRPAPPATHTLQSLLRQCASCGDTLWAASPNYRTITTLKAVLRLTLPMRRCLHHSCPQCQRPYRPEAEGRGALPKHAFGRDGIAVVGPRRSAHHRSSPELHQHLCPQGVAIAPRTVTNLLERSEALLALSRTDTARLQRITAVHGRVILARDGLQPDVGHEVLWVLRDCLSGEVLLARSLLSAAQEDRAALLQEVKQALRVPIVGVIAAGQLALRTAVAQAFPQVPHPLCHCHALREVAKPIYDADRHAHVQGVVASYPEFSPQGVL